MNGLNELNGPQHRFAVLTALATLVLVGIGGLVTSHGVGMAVPDWPNTYGYNMFFFPVSQWIGGIFYEHSHRLVASGVGLMTTVLALWLYGRSARPFMRWAGFVLMIIGVISVWTSPRRATDGLVLALTGLAALAASFFWPRCEPSARWLRRLGVIAFIAVVLQGVLGGLRVVLFKDQIGVVHATLAQMFFVLTCALALFTSRWWAKSGSPKSEGRGPKELRNPKSEPRQERGAVRVSGFGFLSDFGLRISAFYVSATLLILAQLLLGATMRHQHAGLAIPDFPLAYGRLWPAMDAASVAHYNAQRIETVAMNPITGFQISLQMAHRALAVLIFGAVAGCAYLSRRWCGIGSISSRLALTWFGLVLAQALLGAATIWSDKAADIATAHVVIGALSLAAGAMLSIISFREPSADVSLDTIEVTAIEAREAFGVRRIPALSGSIPDLKPVESAEMRRTPNASRLGGRLPAIPR